MSELLKKFQLNDSRSVSTPMATGVQISKALSGKSVDHTLYKGMIGSLLYLTASRPDIMFSVCVCANQVQKNLMLIWLKEYLGI